MWIIESNKYSSTIYLESCFVYSTGDFHSKTFYDKRYWTMKLIFRNIVQSNSQITYLCLMGALQAAVTHFLLGRKNAWYCLEWPCARVPASCSFCKAKTMTWSKSAYAVGDSNKKCCAWLDIPQVANKMLGNHKRGVRPENKIWHSVVFHTM